MASVLGTMREDTHLTSGLKSASRLTNAATSAARPRLRHPIVALSLASLRKRIEIALLLDDVRIVLHLDGLAERERHRRQA